MPQSAAYTVDVIESVLNVFHNTTADEQRRQAEKFLEEFEETDQAWELCHLILEQSRNVKSRHFAARCFKAKIMESVHKIGAQQRVAIRDMLLHHLEKTNDHEDKPVMMALCVALADLALQMSGWPDCASDMIKRYSTAPAFLPGLLEFLTLIPEELNNEKLRLPTAKRAKVKDEMSRASQQVVTFLNDYASGPSGKNGDTMGKIYNCLSTWCNTGSIQIPVFMNVPLVRNLFVYLSDIQTPLPIHDACALCLMSALPDIVHDSSNSRKDADSMVASILKYEELYHQCVQKEEIELCKNYVRIFVALAELILDTEKDAINIFAYPKLLEVLLDCCAHPDYEIVESVIDFWVSLSENVRSSKNPDDGLLLQQCVNRLLCSLWKCCRHDADGDWLEQADDDFEKFRNHVWDCLYDMTEPVNYAGAWQTNLVSDRHYIFSHQEANSHELLVYNGTGLCLSEHRHLARAELCKPLAASFVAETVDGKDQRMPFSSWSSSIENDLPTHWMRKFSPSVQDEQLMQLMSANQAQWDAVESALFLAGAFASRLSDKDDALVKPLVTALVSMQPTSKLCFEHTVLSLFAQLAYWFGRNPEFTEHVLLHIERGLRVKQLADPASRALQEISQYCRPQLTKYFRQLMDLLVRSDAQGLKEVEMESVSKATVNVLNEMPENMRLQCLNELCSLVREPLDKILTQYRGDATKKVDKDREKSLIVWLNHLAAIFKSLSPEKFAQKENPVGEVVNTLWPILADIAVNFVGNDDIMEKIVRCLRYMVRFLGKQSGITLLPVFAKFTDLYAVSSHACILYLASVLVDEFGDLAEARDGFSSMLDTLSVPTLRILCAEGAVRQNPDLIDDFYRLCRRTCERSVEIFLLHPRVDEILQCSVSCCLATNQQANHAVYSLWAAFLVVGYQKPELRAAINAVIERYAPELIRRAFQGIYRDTGIYSVSDVAQLFHDLQLYDPHSTSLSLWLDKALESLPAPTHHADNAQLMQSHITDVRQALLHQTTLDMKVAAISTFVNTYR